ncbi:amidohydrolase [Spirilliplanes yamanashiensis]|uniref:Amidohydrolase n=1 Tax=Spirilliplanes yamanashiensis TaxID=42233 RepID=A0A8J3Y6G0_9ACTN|nr:amidohydrolase [Spirilliplanes yamanashiensis]MDP9814766.1 amidohydrolase [Spirilliplanes yamanashiensis]GIJ02420.1 amidohydrolase [Spirilliplanes yamanashiensis]
MKAALRATVERHAGHLMALGADVFAHPEPAYAEHRTAALVARELRALGLTVEEGLAGTGVRARVRGTGGGPVACVLAELDAVRVPDHPDADPATGYAHACGHHAQVAHLIGVARALVETPPPGDVVLFAVPAEEWSGRPGGKQELIAAGEFAGVDLAMMVHARGDGAPLGMTWRHTGFTQLGAVFHGRAAHAAAAPQHGVNALAAATVALHAVDAQREAFADHVRVHPVLRADTALNVIADRAEVETMVRGLTTADIAAAAERVERSFRAGALALGATVDVTTTPGYAPLTVDRRLGALFAANAQALGAGWAEDEVSTASTDAGDLSALMPVLHPTHGGVTGVNHAASFRITDPYTAYVLPAIALAWTIADLGSPAAGAPAARQ